MLGPFLHTPPPHDEKGKKGAWVIAWLALIMGFVVTLLSVVLPPRHPRQPPVPEAKKKPFAREARPCPTYTD
jgi:hypothetical protein